MASKQSCKQYKPKPKDNKTRRVKKGGAYMDSSSAGTYSYGTSQKQMAELQSGRNTLSVKPAPCVIGGKKHHKKTQNKRKSSKRNRKSRRH